MNSYLEMKNKHQEEVNKFPMYFAFGDEQIKKTFAKLGLDPDKDMDKVVGIGGGGFILKEDKERFKEMFRKHREDYDAAIASDSTGDGFIYEMFLYELNNHEFGYTHDASDTIRSLGLTRKKIESDSRLLHGFKKACIRILEQESEDFWDGW